jgi:hypothetical protein
MATISLTPQRSAAGEFRLLDTDVYRMRIASAEIEEDKFADALADGSKPQRLVLRWEVSEATPEQDEEVVGCAVWQRINPFYGTVREGGPSKFKAFIDSLRAQGLLPDGEELETDAFVGIEQRVSVEKYIKTMGPNAGQPGNKVTAVLPIRRPKSAAPAKAPAKRLAEDEDVF